jgi:predicted RNase H-like HicB family nuclease
VVLPGRAGVTNQRVVVGVNPMPDPVWRLPWVGKGLSTVITFHLGIEDIEPGNWVAWVLELPGCYARGSTRGEALGGVDVAIRELHQRLALSCYAGVTIPSEFSTVIVEEFRAYSSSPDYLVNAYFETDNHALRDEDVVYARCLLDVNRKDLLAVVEGLSAGVLHTYIEGEAQKTIRGILRHIGTAEWWYWDRLGLAFPRSERPDDVFQLLEKIRRFTVMLLPELVGSTRTTLCRGERWSARKLLRRAIWHEHVHTLQIRRYLDGLRSSF